MVGSENKACELQLAYDLSSSVNTKLRVYLNLTASRCSSNLSDIAGSLCRQIFPACRRNYLTFLFTPLLLPTAKEWLSVASCSRSAVCSNKQITGGLPKPRQGLTIPCAIDFHYCHSCYLRVLTQWKKYQPTKKCYIFRNYFLKDVQYVYYWK